MSALRDGVRAVYDRLGRTIADLTARKPYRWQEQCQAAKNRAMEAVADLLEDAAKANGLTVPELIDRMAVLSEQGRALRERAAA